MWRFTPASTFHTHCAHTHTNTHTCTHHSQGHRHGRVSLQWPGHTGRPPSHCLWPYRQHLSWRTTRYSLPAQNRNSPNIVFVCFPSTQRCVLTCTYFCTRSWQRNISSSHQTSGEPAVCSGAGVLCSHTGHFLTCNTELVYPCHASIAIT